MYYLPSVPMPPTAQATNDNEKNKQNKECPANDSPSPEVKECLPALRTHVMNLLHHGGGFGNARDIGRPMLRIRKYTIVPITPARSIHHM